MRCYDQVEDFQNPYPHKDFQNPYPHETGQDPWES